MAGFRITRVQEPFEIMKRIALILVGLVALIHVGIMVLEMYPARPPVLLGRLEEGLGFARGEGTPASPIVWNAGLFNGFLAAGLVWGLIARTSVFQIRAFFLICITIAGIYGAATLPSTVTLWVQSLPAATALVVCFLAQLSKT